MGGFGKVASVTEDEGSFVLAALRQERRREGGGGETATAEEAGEEEQASSSSFIIRQLHEDAQKGRHYQLNCHQKQNLEKQKQKGKVLLLLLLLLIDCYGCCGGGCGQDTPCPFLSSPRAHGEENRGWMEESR